MSERVCVCGHIEATHNALGCTCRMAVWCQCADFVPAASPEKVSAGALSAPVGAPSEDESGGAEQSSASSTAALRLAALRVRDESKQTDVVPDPFGSQGPAILVGVDAYFELVTALGDISQEAARRELGVDAAAPLAAQAAPKEPSSETSSGAATLADRLRTCDRVGIGATASLLLDEAAAALHTAEDRVDRLHHELRVSTSGHPDVVRIVAAAERAEAAIGQSAPYLLLDAERARAEAAEARCERMGQALGEIVRRDAASDYTSINAAPAEFAEVARVALGETT